MPFEIDDAISGVVAGLETGSMSPTYAAARLRLLLSKIREERFAELSKHDGEDVQ